MQWLYSCDMLHEVSLLYMFIWKFYLVCSANTILFLITIVWLSGNYWAMCSVSAFVIYFTVRKTILHVHFLHWFDADVLTTGRVSSLWKCSNPKRNSNSPSPAGYQLQKKRHSTVSYLANTALAPPPSWNQLQLTLSS